MENQGANEVDTSLKAELRCVLCKESLRKLCYCCMSGIFSDTCWTTLVKGNGWYHSHCRRALHIKIVREPKTSIWG